MSAPGNGDNALRRVVFDDLPTYLAPLRVPTGLAPIGSERFQIARRRENARRLTAVITSGGYAFSTNNPEETEVASTIATGPTVGTITTFGSPSTHGRADNRVDLALITRFSTQSGDTYSKPTAEEQASMNRDLASVTASVRVVPSPRWLVQWLSRETLPPVERVLADLPFVNPFHGVQAPVRGVIVIREPSYYVTKAEVLKIMSREAKLVAQPAGTPYMSVYINMARDTGKTGDIYIECQSQAEAQTTVRIFQRRQNAGRKITLGRQSVKMEVGTQEEMMRSLFPNSKNTAWNGQMPVVDVSAKYWQKGQRALAFDGFIAQEEVNLMLKFFSDPDGMPFLSRGPHRLYDAVLTILSKYPVWAPQYILLKDRKRVYDVTLAAVKFLVTHLQDPNRKQNSSLTMILMKELIVNALTFKAFSDAQKSTIVQQLKHEMFTGIIYDNGVQLPFGGTHELASRWPWLILARQPNVSDEFVRFYVKLIYDRSNRSQAYLTKDEKDGVSRIIWNGGGAEPFMTFRVNYGDMTGNLGIMTLADCVEVEMSHLRRVILAGLGDRMHTAEVIAARKAIE